LVQAGQQAGSAGAAVGRMAAIEAARRLSSPGVVVRDSSSARRCSRFRAPAVSVAFSPPEIIQAAMFVFGSIRSPFVQCLNEE